MKNKTWQKTLRALCLLVIGVLLVTYSAEAPEFLLQGMGILLIIPGVLSLLSLLRKEKTAQERLFYPILGTACVALGLVFVIMPSVFVHLFQYVLAVLLVLSGLIQIHSRYSMHRLGIEVGLVSYLLPLLVIAAGIFVFLKPDLAASLPFVILGSGYMLYAVVELFSSYELYRYHKTHPAAAIEEKPVVDADAEEIIEADSDEVASPSETDPTNAE